MTLKIKEKEQVQAKLTKAGLVAYVQAPNQYKNFEVEIQEAKRGNRMIITPGKVDIQVFPDEKNSQAIVWADEEGRTETRGVSTYIGYSTSGKAKEDRLEEIKKAWQRGRSFPLSLPAGTKYKVISGPTVGQGSPNVTGTVKAIIPKSELTLLVGKDESSHFVSALPKRVKTVREAHEVLRPAEVPKGSPRQGEWFFVPATAEEIEKIEKKIEQNPLEIQPFWLDRIANLRTRQAWNAWNVMSSTTHLAQSAILFGSTARGTLFVTGYVLDDRRDRGQKTRHEPLWLHDWHRVVHNAEVDMGDANAETWD